MQSDGEFYLRWVSANAWSESVGLGTTMVVVWLAKPWIDAVTGSPAVLATILVAVSAGGLIEGAVVEFAQQGVLRVRLPTLRPRSWLLATALGAGLAWLLGMLPSTITALTIDGSAQAAAPKPDFPGTIALACGLGLAAGPVLGALQYRVLRRHLDHTRIWFWANALAWGVGMPVLFAGMSYVPWESGDAMQLVIVIFVLCAVVGALVGAVDGGFLLRLLRPDTTPASIECAAVPGNNAKR